MSVRRGGKKCVFFWGALELRDMAYWIMTVKTCFLSCAGEAQMWRLVCACEYFGIAVGNLRRFVSFKEKSEAVKQR